MKRFVAALLSVLMMTGFVAMAEVQRLTDVENEMMDLTVWNTSLTVRKRDQYNFH